MARSVLAEETVSSFMDNNVDKRASVSRRLDERIGTLQEWISMITGQDEPIGTHRDQLKNR